MYYECLEDTTANRCIILGLIDAVKLLKKPCKVNLVTSTPIGVVTVMKKGKGTNGDIINELLNLLKEKNCEAEFFAVEGEGDKLNAYICSKTEEKSYGI